MGYAGSCRRTKVHTPGGARFDISFEGTLKGKDINGKVRGTDFLEVRADGVFVLNLQAYIATDDEL